MYRGLDARVPARSARRSPADGRDRVVRPGDGAGRAGQPARAVRMRQDDGAAHRRRVRAARLRARSSSTVADVVGTPAHTPEHGDGVPELQPVPQPRRQRQRGVRACACAGCQGRAAAPASARRSSGSTSRTWPSATRTNSPAASSSASPWPGRSCSSRPCCCSTSRCRRSTPRSESTSARRSAACNCSSA